MSPHVKTIKENKQQNTQVRKEVYSSILKYLAVYSVLKEDE